MYMIEDVCMHKERDMMGCKVRRRPSDHSHPEGVGKKVSNMERVTEEHFERFHLHFYGYTSGGSAPHIHVEHCTTAHTK